MTAPAPRATLSEAELQRAYDYRAGIVRFTVRFDDLLNPNVLLDAIAEHKIEVDLVPTIHGEQVTVLFARTEKSAREFARAIDAAIVYMVPAYGDEEDVA